MIELRLVLLRRRELACIGLRLFVCSHIIAYRAWLKSQKVVGRLVLITQFQIFGVEGTLSCRFPKLIADGLTLGNF